MTSFKFGFLGSLAVFVFIFSTSLVYAQARPTNLPLDRANPASVSGQGLQRSCEARKAGITTRSNQLIRRANNMLDIFGQISNRAQEFYTNKILPSGKEVEGYNALLEKVATKSASVMEAIDQAEQSAGNFDCTNLDPKTQIREYNQDAKEVISSLKDYRSSVKDLIVAIHSVTGERNRNQKATDSARPNRGGLNR